MARRAQTATPPRWWLVPSNVPAREAAAHAAPESELIEIASQRVALNPQAARRVEDALQDAMQLIATYPHVGRALRDGVRRLALPRDPCLIFYGIAETGDSIDVFAIRHAARQDGA